MSVVKSILLGLGGAAVVATGVATSHSSANAQQVIAATPGACAIYAREYAAVYAPRVGSTAWNNTYQLAYTECLTSGPDFVAGPVADVGRVAGDALHTGAHARARVAGVPGTVVRGGATVTGSALGAGASVAGTALGAGANLAGAALAIPGAILGGTPSAVTPPDAAAPAAVLAPTAPVVTRNYTGGIAPEPVETTSALAANIAPEPFTPEWYAYCDAKYNSFDSETGMYLAYSGTYRMCN